VAVVLVLVIVAYLIVHAVNYRGCTFPPGIFERPTVCL
jgi:hypothetical protein